MDIIIDLTEGFPSFKLKLLLELKDADYVSIVDCTIYYNILLFSTLIKS